MPTGVYPRKLVPRVTVVCVVCGVRKQLAPGAARQRTGRFCSQKCHGEFRSQRQALKCVVCGVSFLRRADKIVERPCCSKVCLGISRREGGARWRDPEQIREYMRAYQKKNRAELSRKDRIRRAKPERKASKLATQRRRRAGRGHISPDQWAWLKKAFDYRCACCLEKKRLELDHIVPLTRDGAHHISNAQPLCRGCNASKGAKDIDYRPEHFRLQYGFAIKEVKKR